MSSIQQQNLRGIDIRQALEILAARGGGGDDQNNNNTSSTSISRDVCCSCQNSPFSAQALQNNAIMGKVIDIFGNNNDNDTAASASAATTTEQRKSHDDDDDDDDEEMKNKQRQQQRQAEMQQQLQSMSITELLQTVLQVQEERVATYRRYDDGLQLVLQSNGNMTQYPTVVAEATASFAVLSDTIRSIRQVVLLRLQIDKNDNTATTATHTRNPDNDDEMKQVAQLLSRLQMAEQNKLHLTAALHLEKIRIHSATKSTRVAAATTGEKGDDDEHTTTSTATTATATNSEAVAAAGDNDKINRLYRQSISSLQTKIGACVEEINEIIDEIRCTMIE